MFIYLIAVVAGIQLNGKDKKGEWTLTLSRSRSSRRNADQTGYQGAQPNDEDDMDFDEADDFAEEGRVRDTNLVTNRDLIKKLASNSIDKSKRAGGNAVRAGVEATKLTGRGVSRLAHSEIAHEVLHNSKRAAKKTASAGFQATKLTGKGIKRLAHSQTAHEVVNKSLRAGKRAGQGLRNIGSSLNPCNC